MIHRPLAALSLLFLLTSAGAVRAGDAAGSDFIPLPASAVPSSRDGTKTPLAAFDGMNSGKAPSGISLALCGIEAHGTETDLDAGLIDRNVSDPARAAGGATDDPKDQGRNVRDYHSAVVLGITLGYRF